MQSRHQHGETKITAGLIAGVILPFSCGYLISYLFRTVNSVIAPDLIAELHLDESGLGLITSAYLYAFTLFQLPLGLLLDRYGPRRTHAILLAIAALGSLMFAIAPDPLTLTVSRAVIGMGLSGGLMAAFKANALWLPPARVPLANSVVVAFGGLGVFAATGPSDWMANHFGWRSLFYLLAAVTLLVAILVYWLAPHGNGQPEHAANAPKSWRAQLRDIGPILATRTFWGIAPMVAFVTGGFIAIQSLWTARWLTDVRLLDRGAVAGDLMAMAITFSAGSLITGFVADWAHRRDIGLKAVMIGCFVILACAELGIILDAPLPAWLLVGVLGLAGSGSNLAYVTLGDQFGPALAGRAQTSLNLLLFLAAALLQSGIGWALDLLNAIGFGAGAEMRYATVLGAMLAIQVLSVLWFARTTRERR
ncbi:MFS transporter [Dongia sedimenti]|uniref:MFS transporter n=1 Tax=Dongia sedimenti TaxID=3064282 RepID=A0ABU0YHY2_9PROT|nr:MFS transporter [Rhodospirillaceae bacterium R-7]